MMLRMSASSSSPTQLLWQVLGMSIVVFIFTGIVVQMSPARHSQPKGDFTEVAGLTATAPSKGKLMRREPRIESAPPVPRPEGWGKLMRRELPQAPHGVAENDDGSSPATDTSRMVFLMLFGMVALTG